MDDEIKEKDTKESESNSLIYEDALGNKVEFTEQEIKEIADGTKKVAVLNGSFAERRSTCENEMEFISIPVI